MPEDDDAPQRAPRARWAPDPEGVHQLRYYDGGAWTEHVADGGQLGEAPLGGGAAGDPHTAMSRRGHPIPWAIAAVTTALLAVFAFALAGVADATSTAAKHLDDHGVAATADAVLFVTDRRDPGLNTTSGKCRLGEARATFRLDGAPTEAVLRYATVDDRPSCADVVRESEARYGAGIALLVDPADHAKVAARVDVDRIVGMPERGPVFVGIGWAFAIGALIAALVALLAARRRPAHIASAVAARRAARPPSAAPACVRPGPPAPSTPTATAGRHRPAGTQLHRSPAVMHVSWILGLAVLVGSGITFRDFTAAGIVFLGVVFLPIVVAYRRDRLSFVIVFAALFLPTWPFAMYKAMSGPQVPI